MKIQSCCAWQNWSTILFCSTLDACDGSHWLGVDTQWILFVKSHLCQSSWNCLACDDVTYHNSCSDGKQSGHTQNLSNQTFCSWCHHPVCFSLMTVCTFCHEMLPVSKHCWAIVAQMFCCVNSHTLSQKPIISPLKFCCALHLIYQGIFAVIPTVPL